MHGATACTRSRVDPLLDGRARPAYHPVNFSIFCSVVCGWTQRPSRACSRCARPGLEDGGPVELGLFEEPDATVRVSRWPSEIPLLILVVLLSAGLWILFAVSM